MYYIKGEGMKLRKEKEMEGLKELLADAEITCPFCGMSIEIYKARKGYYGQCYLCGSRFFGRSLASFLSLAVHKGEDWKRAYFKKIARNGAEYYYDAKRGLRAFRYPEEEPE